jgi:dihydrofolate reductase
LKIIIISAVAENGVIGRANGEMPWHVSEEFNHFKKTTMGFPIIMGRKTFESLGKPLKGRKNIVITRSSNFFYQSDDVKIFNSLSEGIDFAKSINKEKIFITGGGEIYKQSIPIADEMILSHMKFTAEGEVKFPQISDKDWMITERVNHEQFEIVYYKRKR